MKHFVSLVFVLLCAMLSAVKASEYSNIELILLRPILLSGAAGEVPIQRSHYLSAVKQAKK